MVGLSPQLIDALNVYGFTSIQEYQPNEWYYFIISSPSLHKVIRGKYESGKLLFEIEHFNKGVPQSPILMVGGLKESEIVELLHIWFSNTYNSNSTHAERFKTLKKFFQQYYGEDLKYYCEETTY